MVEAACSLAGWLAIRDEDPPVAAIPTPAGTIHFEWREGPAYREFEVVSPDLIEWMEIDGRGRATHGEFAWQRDAIYR